MTLLHRTTTPAEVEPANDWLFGLPALWPHLSERVPRIEEFAEDGTVVIRMEMPGIDPDKDVEVTVSDGTLRIQAHRREETKSDDTRGFRSEFRYGSYTRTVNLPAGATDDDVKATYRDGILEVRVPVSEARAAARTIPVTRV